MPYSEHVGVNRQAPGRIGDRNLLYPLNRIINKQFINYDTSFCIFLSALTKSFTRSGYPISSIDLCAINAISYPVGRNSPASWEMDLRILLTLLRSTAFLELLSEQNKSSVAPNSFFLYRIVRGN